MVTNNNKAPRGTGVRANAAEGVIFAAPSFCDPALLERPMLEKVLDRVDVPHIGFKYAENSAQLQPVREVVKEASMVKQKEMIARNYDLLTSTAEHGRKVASTFVPGNLNELIMCFDMLNNLPEINAIQNGMRKISGDYITEAEKRGHSEDVCT